MSPSKHSNPEIPDDKSLIQKYIQAMSSEDEEIRRNAIRRLGQLGPQAAPALPQLRIALFDPDFITRLEAAVAIGFIGTNEDSKFLLPLLDDEIEAVRFQAISALAYLRDSRVTPDLLCRYKKETIQVQDQILRALGHLGGSEVYNLLEQELDAKNPIIRTGAIVGLSFLGDSRACAPLKKVAETDSDEVVVHEAKIALLQLAESCSQDAKNDEK